MKVVSDKNVSYYSRTGLDLHQSKLLELLGIISDVCAKASLKYWIDGGTLLGLERHGALIPWDDDVDICLPVDDYFTLIDILAEMTAKSDSNFTLIYKDSDLISWSEYFGFKNHVCEYKWGGLKPIRVDLIPIKEISFDDINFDEKKVEKLAKLTYGKNNSNISFDSKLDAKLYKEKQFKEYNHYMRSNNKVEGDCYLVKGHGQFSPIKKVRKALVYPLQERCLCGISVFVPNDVSAYLVQSYGPNYMALPDLEKRKPIAYSAYKREGQLHELNKVTQFDYTRFSESGKITSSIKFIFFIVKTFGMKHMFSVLNRNILRGLFK
ncbi:putative enzyme [Vibrio chagasii]|nr:putative enzyme [Vibrio chagasii]CAH7427392.1 putative enzyme [Vibrio chagasii]